jgi:hypothetical protein
MKIYKGLFLLFILFCLSGCFDNQRTEPIPTEPIPTEPEETIIETEEGPTEEELIALSNQVRAEMLAAIEFFKSTDRSEPYAVNYERFLGNFFVYRSNHVIDDTYIIETVETLQYEYTEAYLKRDDLWVNLVQDDDFYRLGYRELNIPELFDLEFTDATRYSKTDLGFHIQTTLASINQIEQNTLDYLKTYINLQGGQSDTPIEILVRVYFNMVSIEIDVVTDSFEIHEIYQFVLGVLPPVKLEEIIRSDAISKDEVTGYMNLGHRYSQPVSMAYDLYTRYHLEASDYVIDIIYDDFELIDALGNTLVLESSLVSGSRFAFSIEEDQDVYLKIGKTDVVFVETAIYQIDALDYEIGETFLEVEYTESEMHFDQAKEFHPVHVTFITDVAMVYIIATEQIDDIVGPDRFYQASFSDYSRIQFTPMDIEHQFSITLTKPTSFSLILGNDDTIGATQETPYILRAFMSYGFIASNQFQSDIFQLTITEAGLYTFETTGVFINIFLYNSQGTRISSPTDIFQLQPGTYQVKVESDFYQTYGIRYIKLES